MALGGGAITERDPNATMASNPKRPMHAMVRARRCIFAPPENPAPAKIFDLPIHCLRPPVPELGWLPEFRQSERASPRKVLRTWDLRRLRSGIVAEIVECVPNFSEGRRKEVVDEIAKSIASVSGVRVLDAEMDSDHNRSVITFIGDRAGVAEAAFQGARTAVARIDMNGHRGAHPRVGALDVLPFVPILGVTMDDCGALARSVGKRIADELQVPVYLYEAAATRPDRKALPNLRRGEYEGLKAAIETDPDRKPDFGPSRLHPTAGACIVGARPVLIAWNVNLGTKDVGIAKRIAKAIRESDGGLPAVRAKGFELPDRGLVQVSMNMTDYQRTSLVQAFEAIRSLAAEEGVEIIESEIIGLVPLDAILAGATQYFKLARLHRQQIFAEWLWDWRTWPYKS